MIIGHEKKLQFLKKSIQLNLLSHAYLFYGESQIGKRTIAMELAKFIYCETICNKCRNCLDIEKKVHPDVIIIEPQNNNIPISKIRDLQSALALTGSQGKHRVVIIDQAHCLNQDAQSAFLKILEEPKGKIIFFLITAYPEILFSTILSRVCRIYFSPVPALKIKDFLTKKKLKQEEINELITLSFGKPGLVLDFLSDKNLLEERRRKMEEVIKLKGSDLFLRFQYAKYLSQDAEETEKVLEIWLRYFRQRLLNGSDTDYSLKKLLKIIKLIQDTNFLISSTNVNSKLALENLLIEF